MKLAGAYAVDTLRLEKGFCHWGHKLDTETTPWEAGLGFAVDMNKVKCRALRSDSSSKFEQVMNQESLDNLCYWCVPWKFIECHFLLLLLMFRNSSVKKLSSSRRNLA